MELINVDNINSEEEIIAELSNMNGRKNKRRRIILDLISPDEFFGADKFKISKMAILCYKYLKLIFCLFLCISIIYRYTFSPL